MVPSLPSNHGRSSGRLTWAPGQFFFSSKELYWRTICECWESRHMAVDCHPTLGKACAQGGGPPPSLFSVISFLLFRLIGDYNYLFGTGTRTSFQHNRECTSPLPACLGAGDRGHTLSPFQSLLAQTNVCCRFALWTSSCLLPGGCVPFGGLSLICFQNLTILQ